jgi:glycine cleavage system H protein
MNIPKDLVYTTDHEWVKFKEEGVALIGLTNFAQEQLGNIVFVNLPEVGDTVTIGQSFSDVESVKAVSDLISPVTGVITAINEDLLDAPEGINDAAYDAWFIEVSEISEKDDLMSADEYEAHCKGEK